MPCDDNCRRTESRSLRNVAAKLTFVLSNDFGELFNALYFLHSSPFEATLLLPPRLMQVNQGTLPFPAQSYQLAADIAEAVERTAPDAVVLFSGYLLVLNKLLTVEELQGLLDAWRRRGTRIITSDPSLGLIAQGGGLFQERFAGARALTEHFAWLRDQLADAFHVYLAPGAIEIERDHGSYFNPLTILSDTDRARRAATLATWSLLDRERTRWLFILSPEDEALQVAALGRAAFTHLLTQRLLDVSNAGRQPVLIAPAATIAAVRATGDTPSGLIALSGCGYFRFMLLLHDAEYVFYWNQFSASMLARVLQRQPIFTFAPGHLVHALREIQELGSRHFYLGLSPTALDLAESLSETRLSELALRQLESMLKPVSEYLAQSPTPEQLVRSALRTREGT